MEAVTRRQTRARIPPSTASNQPGQLVEQLNARAAESVRPPIFASTDPGPEIYRTVSALTSYAEAIDVENGEWSRIYDAAGNRLLLVVDPGDVVRLQTTTESQPDQLAEWLRSSLLARGRARTGLEDDWLEAASLSELVAAFDAYEAAWRAQLPLARVGRWLRRLRKGGDTSAF